MLILIDQEGGDVKRLPSLPPDRSPAEIGASQRPASDARDQGKRTASALAKLGINVDLAPVADVPFGAASFLGSRAFGASPTVVARAACGFLDGLRVGGVAGSLKHFPGLGRARGNTDLKPIRVDAGVAAIERDLAAYRRCAKRAPMVMISSASYPALGINRPAVLEKRTYGMLRDLGFRGVTISDAFDTPAIANQTRPALAAIKAGIDILLYGMEETGARLAFERLREDVRAGVLSRSSVTASAERVIAFKSRLIAKTR